MKPPRIVLVTMTLLLSGCMSTPQQKGTVTVEGIGTKALTTRGDSLMQTGIYAKREVSEDFAAGYEKGLSDAVKREYWSMQEAQRFYGR
jgi:type IV pilus biogenesis protein CpaD/CtpE